MPKTASEWNNLMIDAIDAARKAENPLLSRLERAFREGQSEAMLRKLGIITPSCIVREFPAKP